jgi:hypothetical protein
METIWNAGEPSGPFQNGDKIGLKHIVDDQLAWSNRGQRRPDGQYLKINRAGRHRLEFRAREGGPSGHYSWEKPWEDASEACRGKGLTIEKIVLTKGNAVKPEGAGPAAAK